MQPPRLRRVAALALFAFVPLVGFGTITATGTPAFAQPAAFTFGPSADAGTSDGVEPQTYIVRFANDSDAADEAESLRAKGADVRQTFQYAMQGAVVKATPAEASALKRSDRVASVEPDARVSIQSTQQPAPWPLDRIDQREALPLSGSYTPFGTGSSVSIYVVDTGILATHIDFGDRVMPGWVAPRYGLSSSDCNGHGTHVAGIAAGTKYGVAKSATLVPVRVLDCDGAGYDSDVIAGLDWVVAQHSADTPAVVNLSLGGPAGLDSTALESAIQAVIDDGITVTVAAGNTSTDACTRTPARLPAVLTVAATNSTDRQSYFSNYGSCVDIFAPGEKIESDWSDSDTAIATLNGTSMAAPHVAGAAAAILSQSPSLSPAQVAASILGSATNGSVTNTNTGTPNRLLYVNPLLPGTYSALAPFRQLDTRYGTGGFSGPVGPGATVRLPVAGRGGIPQAGTISAVAVNVTVTEPAAPGNITVYAGGTSQPGTSNLNFSPGQSVPNLVIAPVSADGTIALTNNSNGTVHLIADTSGYYLAGSPSGAGTFSALAPFRQLDTRYGTGGFSGPVAPGATVRLPVAGRGGIPQAGTISAVAVNVTVTEPAAPGNITVYAGGTSQPGTSNLNFSPGQSVPNLVIAPVSADGTIALTNNSNGTVHLIADTSGYYLAR